MVRLCVMFILSCIYAVQSFGTLVPFFQESFADGNFSVSPVWTGDTESWIVVSSSDVAAGATASSTLRLNVPTAAGTGFRYLSTPLNLNWQDEQEWLFWLGRRSQAATAANTIYCWLYLSVSNPLDVQAEGYRLRWGDDQSAGDRLILEYVKAAKTETILSSAPVPNGLTDIGITIRVSRNSSGLWKLYTSSLPQASGNGTTAADPATAETAGVYQSEGQHQSPGLSGSGYFCLAVTQTSSAAARAGVEMDQLTILSGGLTVVPVRFSSLQALNIEEGVRLTWLSLTESDIHSYQIQRFEHGVFQEVGFVAAHSDPSSGRYEFLDRLHRQGCYRILAVENSGRQIASEFVCAKEERRSEPLLEVFPNPISGIRLRWKAEQFPPGVYQLLLCESTGRVVVQREVRVDGQDEGEILLPILLAPGFFVLSLRGKEYHQAKIIVVR